MAMRTPTEQTRMGVTSLPSYAKLKKKNCRRAAAGHLHGGVRRAAGRVALAAVAGPGAARHVWGRAPPAALQLTTGAGPGPPAAAAG